MRTSSEQRAVCFMGCRARMRSSACACLVEVLATGVAEKFADGKVLRAILSALHWYPLRFDRTFPHVWRNWFVHDVPHRCATALLTTASSLHECTVFQTKRSFFHVQVGIEGF